MIKAIVGTAGHVDHGKTALLKALTGIDCDRLPEEKEREITIDLGFAYLKAEEVQIGFIDVPGHERFLKNLLAGISGFQFFLFCVALDEGIKAQTIEHMQILKTLGLKKGIVALTKMDLVREEEIKRRKLEILYLFEREGFTNINLIPVSAHKGTNILNLKEELVKLIKENPPMANLNPPVIYPIDRVFTLKGKGVITTGTLIRGELKLGEELFLNPSLKKIRIKGIEIHKEKREVAKAFERVALQISGVEKEDLKRGIILSDISLPQTKLITVKLNLIKEIKENTRLRIAHHTEEAFGRYYKIDENLAQIFLEEPIPALKGDKVVLRRFAPPEFFGSGEIVDTFLEKVKKDEKINLGKSLKEDINFWIEKAGIQGINKDFLWVRSGYFEAGLFEKILKELEIVEHNKVLWTKGNYQRLKNSLIENVKIYESKNSHSFSLPLKNLSGILEIDLNEEVLQKIIEELNFKIERGNIILKGKEELTEDLKKILKVVKDNGLTTPDPDTLSKEIGIPAKELKVKLRDLVQRGFLVQVSVGYYIEKDVLENAIKKLKNTGWEKFTISDFKELFGISRKYAVPLLEYLDSRRITIRTKDLRILKK